MNPLDPTDRTIGTAANNPSPAPAPSDGLLQDEQDPPAPSPLDARTLGRLVSTVDQHERELEALGRVVRSTQRNVVIILGAIAYLTYVVGKGIKDAGATLPG
jgi:hypothetical protein